jgi:hypothetical protein
MSHQIALDVYIRTQAAANGTTKDKDIIKQLELVLSFFSRFIWVKNEPELNIQAVGALHVGEQKHKYSAS